MMNKCIGAAVGLARAAYNEEMTDPLAELFIGALTAEGEEEQTAMIGALHDAKAQYAPDCAVCPSPCGRTADYDLADLQSDAPQDREAKERLIQTLCEVAKRPDARAHARMLLQSVCSLGDRLDAADYCQICEKLMQ